MLDFFFHKCVNFCIQTYFDIINKLNVVKFQGKNLINLKQSMLKFFHFLVNYLLNPHCFLFILFAVREHRELGVYIDKLTKHIVTDVSELFGLIDKGKKNR